MEYVIRWEGDKVIIKKRREGSDLQVVEIPIRILISTTDIEGFLDRLVRMVASLSYLRLYLGEDVAPSIVFRRW